MNRKEAIETLRQRGFHVRERKWVLGDTILVAAALVEHNGIKAYRIADYLIPGQGEAWSVTDHGFRRGRDNIVFPSLAEAVEAITQFTREAVADLERRDSEESR